MSAKKHSKIGNHVYLIVHYSTELHIIDTDAADYYHFEKGQKAFLPSDQLYGLLLCVCVCFPLVVGVMSYRVSVYWVSLCLLLRDIGGSVYRIKVMPVNSFHFLIYATHDLSISGI